MKNHLSIALSLTLAVLSCPALAHDASMHEPKDAAAPDCSSLKTMAASKMDMNDPLMKALYDQCKNTLPQDAMHGHDMKEMPGLDMGADQPSSDGGK